MYNKAKEKSSQKNLIVSGLFTLSTPDSFYINDTKLLIRERKNPTPKKPKYFLSAFPDGKYTYVSSLFKVVSTDTGDIYNMDFNCKNYEVELKKTEIEIKEIP